MGILCRPLTPAQLLAVTLGVLALACDAGPSDPALALDGSTGDAESPRPDSGSTDGSAAGDSRSDDGGGLVEAAADAAVGPICGSAPIPSPLVETLNVSGSTGTVTWYGGCWYYGTIFGVTGNYQSVDFAMTTSKPIPLEGTLFFAANCDASGGTDNMNDYGTTTSSTHMIQGFSHHPDSIPSSALYWMGPRTTDGLCPAGAPCSGCINYDLTTPCCGALP